MASDEKLVDQEPPTVSPSEKEEPDQESLAEPEPAPEAEPENAEPAAPAPEPLESPEAEPAQHHTPIPDTEDEVVEEYVEPSPSILYYAWVLVLLTFGALVIPLAMFILPYTRSSHDRHTSKPHWETVPPITDKDNPVVPSKNVRDCGQQLTPDESPPLPTTAGFAPFVPDTSTRQHRTLFCVFDTKYHRTVKPYLPKNVPYSYCTYILYYSVSFSSYGAHFRRSLIDPNYIEQFNFIFSFLLCHCPPQNLTTAGNFQRLNNAPIPIILTAGGEISDTANISLALRSKHTRLSTATQLVEITKYHLLQGINFHWEYPTAPCGTPNDTDNLIEFFKELGQMKKSLSTASRPFYLMLTVPARGVPLQRYGMDHYVDVLDYILVPTHELHRDKNTIGCSVRRRDITTIMIRLSQSLKDVSLGGKSTLTKLCFSLSLGPNTFRADVPHVGVSATRGAAIDRASRDPLKAGFYEVCKLPGVSDTGDSECSLSFVTGSPFLVATYMTPANIRVSLGNTYKDGLGDTCIVLFDMDLDDFAGECTAYNTHSPLTAAVVSA